VRPVTVTIVACNEEENIASAVASASWADDVLVLDSGSSDRTVAVAEAAGARAMVEAWRGYGAQKNRAAELAGSDWVLSLDADERVGERLARAVTGLADGPACHAFRIRRRNYFGDRAIRRWPWSWDETVRLYDRRRARFSERTVHESVLCDGAVGSLPGVLEHFSYTDWEDYGARQLRYARLGAEEAARRGRRPRAGDLSMRPAVTFLRHWLGRGYLLGGALGWRLSVAAARGTYLKYGNLRELSRHGVE